jgi:hypothetical protein
VEIGQIYEATSQHSTPQRRISNHSHSKLPARFQQRNLVVFDVKRERRVFDLDSGDGMNGMSTAKSLGRNFR